MWPLASPRGAAATFAYLLALVGLFFYLHRPAADGPSRSIAAPAAAQASIQPDFRDPDLAGLPAVAGEHPLARSLQDGLAAYRRRWGGLPQVAIEPGVALAQGDRGARVATLRRRLGLPSGDGYDGTLSEAVRNFQMVHGLGVNGVADAETIAALNAGADYYVRKIELNIARANALPLTRGRWILVDAASARLWMYEDDRQVGTMPVIVGKPEMPTPTIFGLIRFAVFNPYWNVPPDLARDRIAPAVLREGPTYLSTHRYEILSDWSDTAHAVAASQVDWKGAAGGAFHLRVRQLPGVDNMMGAVKFMSPNPYGVYLHDTPAKALFQSQDRHKSSGCIRLWNAPVLARWLFSDAVPNGAGNDQRSDLPRPVPVYISYFTVLPDAQGVRFVRDIYGRDEEQPHVTLRPGSAS